MKRFILGSALLVAACSQPSTPLAFVAVDSKPSIGLIGMKGPGPADDHLLHAGRYVLTGTVSADSLWAAGSARSVTLSFGVFGESIEFDPPLCPDDFKLSPVTGNDRIPFEWTFHIARVQPFQGESQEAPVTRDGKTSNERIYASETEGVVHHGHIDVRIAALPTIPPAEGILIQLSANRFGEQDELKFRLAE